MAHQIAIGAAGGLIVEVVKGSFGLVKRHVCYFFNHESKVKSLNDQLEKLKDKKDGVQHCADAATRNGRQIVQGVQKWLTKVDNEVREDEAELRKYEDEVKKRCFLGICPRFMSRYHLSKMAKKEANLVVELLTEADQFPTDQISFDPDPQLMVATSAHQRGFETFQSREAVLQDILKALIDPSIQRIGVFGMGGVGKTMLMKEVASIAKRDNLFDEVAIATISNSQKTDIKKAQGEIADALGFKFQQETESGRAIGLRQRLNNGKRILVILDDIWDKVDLESIGIIFEENQNRGKLMLTSRSSDTFGGPMNVEKTFELRILSPEESMILFTKIVGNKVEEPGYKHVAIDVVAKCAGLPVAISALANALKEKENALQQVKRANPKSIEGMEKSVYSALRLSYEYLQYKPAQTLLLLCSLWPQGLEFSITDLIKCSWGMDLLEDVCSMEEARNNVTTHIQKLKSSSLLLCGDTDAVLRMHDVVRDVCISIAGEDNQMFVIDEQVHFEKLLKSKRLENCTALSLPYGNIGELPNILNCAQLQFFGCFSEGGSLRVPDVFFKETKELKVLHLTGMELSSLALSFLSLTNLRTLCLEHCMLQDIAIVGELKNLEVLSISKCGIRKLPIQFANLSMLKMLDLSKCYDLKVIPDNLISSLHRLEELYMSSDFDKWDSEGNASLSELKYLNDLIALDIHICDGRIIPKDLFSQNLERYNIHIGKGYDWYHKPERSRLLNVELYTHMYLDDSIEMLLKKTEDLRIIMPLKGIMKVISILDGTGSHLKDLYINISENEEEIIETSSMMGSFFNHKGMLCYLENLELYRINNPSIWNNELSTWPTNLTSFIVSECNNLKHLFSTSMARCLKQLKDLRVWKCQSMIDIIATEVEKTTDVILFPNLDFLDLDKLPKLTRFSENLIEFSFLRTLHILSCPILKSFVSNAATMETLVREEAERNDFKEDESSNMPTLFNENMLARLQRLDNLEIDDCYSVEEIFECEEPNLGKPTTIKYELPTLTKVGIRMLPKLRSFSCKAVQCPSLRSIWVQRCHQLQLLFRSEEYISFGKPQQQKESQQPLFWVNKIGLPSVEELTLKSNVNLEQIWVGQLPSECSLKLKHVVLFSMSKLIRWAWDEKFEPFQQVFNKLTTLEVSFCGEFKNLLVPSSISFSNLVTMTISDCHGLISLLTPSTAKSLVNLTTMTISHCDEIKEIIAKDGAEDDIIFTQLEYVELDCLRKLEGFCLGNCSIQFPSLVRLYAPMCCNMKIFCQGEVVAPKLQRLYLGREEWSPAKIGEINNSLLQITKVEFDSGHIFSSPYDQDDWFGHW